jgi:glycosyltransferase involved in cell wall biosynthesis
MREPKRIVMLGTGFATRGGISSVVNVYREAGLFERYPIIYVSTHGDGGALRKLRICIAALARYLLLLLRGRVALAHVHMSTGMSFWRKLLFACPTLLAGVPVILHLHGADFAAFHRDGGMLRKWAMRALFDRAAAIIVLSKSWQRWAQRLSRNPLIVPIFNPVVVPAAGGALPREPASILFLGQLGSRKGAYELLQAAALLVARHPRLRLRMAGDGEVEEVRAAAGHLGLGAHVEVLEWVAGARKSALLASASVYALPSYCEALPMSVLEAMAAGLPVVCTPVGGIPEAVTDGVEGAIVAPGDVAALAAALDMLLSDAAARERMGQAARLRIESSFSAARVLPQIGILYERLGARRAGQSGPGTQRCPR